MREEKKTSITFSLVVTAHQTKTISTHREREKYERHGKSFLRFQMNMQQCQAAGQRQVQPDRFLCFLFIPMIIVFLKLAQFARPCVCLDLFGNLGQKANERRKRKRRFISTAMCFDLPDISFIRPDSLK